VVSWNQASISKGFKVFASIYIWVTTLTFHGHAT